MLYKATVVVAKTDLILLKICLGEQIKNVGAINGVITSFIHIKQGFVVPGGLREKDTSTLKQMSNTQSCLLGLNLVVSISIALCVIVYVAII